MKVAVWFTGHPICDTVAKSLVKGFNADAYHTSRCSDAVIRQYDCHIGYGILRGMSEVFKAAERLRKPWFNVDKGYESASHFDGFYRISCRGTQAKWPGSRVQLAIDSDALTLICPPTPDVCQFFDVDAAKWLHSALSKNCIVRFKSDAQREIPWSKIELVRTFNSSVGWQALRRGIPCVSDSNHSVIGSYYNYIDNNESVLHLDTEPLFAYMIEHQFTLKQIEEGNAWALIQNYQFG